MNELDLHGLSHDEGLDKAEDFVLRESVNIGFTCRLITGNSKPLQQRIFRMLDKYEFNYYVPASNLGEIIIRG